ncbi:MAG: heavy-metal-associated domain-containing protein [Planctomycetota bacterium]|jgi:copper chaperone
MNENVIKIDGMSCQHCVMRVKKAIDAIDGVSSSVVEIGKADITYDETKTSLDAIKEAINGSGYKIVG